MNPKVLFLLYGVFVVGSSYEVKAQIISTLSNDANSLKGVDKTTGKHLFPFAARQAHNPETNTNDTIQKEVLQNPRAPADSKNEDWQSNSQLVYYCRFSDKGLENFIC
jgi:hypothetical protein